MRILREGKRPENKLYQVECRECKTEFEFVRSEATLTFDNRDGDFLTIGCPLCGKPVTHAV